MSKIWANSGDSHLVEPDGLFEQGLPPALAERMPRSVKDDDGRWETVHVDGQTFRRRIPSRPLRDTETGMTVAERAPGAGDPVLRLKDLDAEGIWAELIYPSIGIWTSSIEDPALLREGVKVINDWAIGFQRTSPRFVCTASVPLLAAHDAVAEIERAAGLGYKAAFFPVAPPPSQPAYQHDVWEPVWAALEETGLVLSFHIGTEPHDAGSRNGTYHSGPGGAVLNYFETTFGGQRCTAQLIASGALDRHPGLRVMVSEGGATWGPFMADRLDEGYRQHASAVRPTLSKPPSRFLYEQVYASFQHDRSAVPAQWAMGWENVMWGSDYPHIEGTFGHTQKTLHELFDDVDEVVRRRITLGAFEELFPHVPPCPAESGD
ncbi:MAG TPA: amidohydrolase family protein [Acidimicrobiales bacterium]|nr:amidohydrolase family protein [Acidimicrobiales bacterium]